MTFARLILEIRRRAAGLPQQLPKPLAIEQAAREVLQTAMPGEELDTTRQILAAPVVDAAHMPTASLLRQASSWLLLGVDT
jgi:hypothetical protein